MQQKWFMTAMRTMVNCHWRIQGYFVEFGRTTQNYTHKISQTTYRHLAQPLDRARAVCGMPATQGARASQSRPQLRKMCARLGEKVRGCWGLISGRGREQPRAVQQQCNIESQSSLRDGESCSDSVSTQECAKLHLRASIFPKIFLGGHAPRPPWGPPLSRQVWQKNYPRRFSGSATVVSHKVTILAVIFPIECQLISLK